MSLQENTRKILRDILIFLIYIYIYIYIICYIWLVHAIYVNDTIFIKK